MRLCDSFPILFLGLYYLCMNIPWTSYKLWLLADLDIFYAHNVWFNSMSPCHFTTYEFIIIVFYQVKA